MSAPLFILSTITMWCCLSTVAQAQGETALPFLLMHTSAEGNGMGGVSTMLSADDALAPSANPAYLGQMARNAAATASIYIPATDVLPGFALPDMSYSVLAVNGGIRLTDYLSLPLTLGLGYSRVSLDLGTFRVTGSGGPEVLGTFEAYEYSNNFTLAVGAEYLARVSMGVSAKQVTSHLAPIGTEQVMGAAEASLWAWDIGLIASLPVVTALEGITGTSLSTSGGLSPVVDAGFGYVQANIGDGVSYFEGGQTDPLPRRVGIGANLTLGLAWRQADREWMLLSFIIGREGEDLLVERYDDGSYSYTAGTGDINFWDNVILGKTPEKADLRRGWQVQCAEVAAVRGGSVDRWAPWTLRYETSGYSLKLGGLLKLIGWVEPGARDLAWFSFLADHIDLQYHHSRQESESGPSVTFSSLNLVLRRFPI